jgi:hypothetical protein
MAASRAFNDPQVMFTLAMLSYLGTQNLNTGPLNGILLRTALDEALDRVEPVRGDWEVAWGPVTYSAPFTVFADSAAFVVRNRRQPARLAVVIRGTNPLSAFDWVCGDLWTDRVVPWRSGERLSAPGAAISLSSALGLSILQNMRWLELPDFGLEEVIGGLRRGVLEPAERVARRLLAPVRWAAAGVLARARGGLLRDLATIRAERDALARDLGARLRFYARARRSPPAVRARQHVDRSLAGAVGNAEVDLLRLMEGVQRAEARLHPGQGLLGFLESEARRAEAQGVGPLEVFVTGHSKGGALAPLAAQWLCETRRTSRGGWNRELDAAIHCYAFAGPTPGNLAFARLYDRTLGPRGHRISNRNDLVPHAWAVPSPHLEPHLDLLQVPDLYRNAVDLSPKAHQLLHDLVVRIADEVRPLEYAHTSEGVHVFEGKIDGRTDDFFAHVLNQHTMAYIRELGLEGDLDFTDMFTPL